MLEALEIITRCRWSGETTIKITDGEIWTKAAGEIQGNWLIIKDHPEEL